MAKVLEEQRAILQKAAKPRIEGSGVLYGRCWTWKAACVVSNGCINTSHFEALQAVLPRLSPKPLSFSLWPFLVADSEH